MSGLEERYLRAVGSTRLRVEEDSCSVDVLIAAGWAREGLGTCLYRLRAEYERVSSQKRAAEESLRLALAAARREKSPGVGDVMRMRAHDAASNEVSMILANLPALPEARRLLLKYAGEQAFKQGAGISPNQVRRMAAQAMEAYLDPSCGTCRGRMMVEKPNVPAVPCSACCQTGRRTAVFSGSDEEESFGQWLLTELESKVSNVERAMSRFLRSGRKIISAPGTLRA